MNICVAGWYFKNTLKDHGSFVVAHRDHPDADVVINNVGLEFGCYGHYLAKVWNGGKTLFTHDDNEITEEALKSIDEYDADQAFLFSSENEKNNNGGVHGRAFVCSDRFLKRFKEDGGFWYDEGNSGNIPPTTDAPDYHNNAIKIFNAYLNTITDMRVNERVIIPGLKLGYRGEIRNG